MASRSSVDGGAATAATFLTLRNVRRDVELATAVDEAPVVVALVCAHGSTPFDGRKIGEHLQSEIGLAVPVRFRDS